MKYIVEKIPLKIDLQGYLNGDVSVDTINGDIGISHFRPFIVRGCLYSLPISPIKLLSVNIVDKKYQLIWINPND